MFRFPPQFPLIAAAALLTGGCSLFHGPLDDEVDDATEMEPHPRRTELPPLVGSGNERIIPSKFPVIRFAGDGWEIPSAERAKIKSVAKWFMGHPERVLISAGAQVSPPEYARQISDQRAQSVRGELIDAGVPASKILTVAYGEDAPPFTGKGVSFSAIATGEAP